MDINMNEMNLRPAVLAGLNVGNNPKFEKSMRELAALAEAAGMEVRAVFTQNLAKPNTGYYIGSGKIEEIRAYLEETNRAAVKESSRNLHNISDANNAQRTGKDHGNKNRKTEDISLDKTDLVIFDSQLSPIQLKNLSDAFSCEVLDRTALILKIFAERARTREASLQVEYARYQYLLPRLRGMHDDLGRQAGASGAMSNKGLGEKKIELDRRRIEQRMAELRKELEEIDRERDTQRKRRLRSGLPRVSLVGYTNAGKSTILNEMLRTVGTEENKVVFEEDMLFATLDTTVRRIEPPDGGKPFLLADTVGFIDNLPTMLVKAFRSTLEETQYADILLIVSDVSDPEYRENLTVTIKTLEEIGAGEIPRIFVFNKADRTHGASKNISHKELRPGDERITISAKNRNDILFLMRLIGEVIRRSRVSSEMLIPYSEGGVLNALMENGETEILGYTEHGTHVRCVLPEEVYRRYERFAVIG